MNNKLETTWWKLAVLRFRYLPGICVKTLGNVRRPLVKKLGVAAKLHTRLQKRHRLRELAGFIGLIYIRILAEDFSDKSRFPLNSGLPLYRFYTLSVKSF
jgi:hypothetical protein